MPASMSLERRELLKSYGAEVVLTEPERVMDGALEAARAHREERGAFMPEQFDNDANPTVHARTTAQRDPARPSAACGSIAGSWRRSARAAR
jgi:cysteine synthase A